MYPRNIMPNLREAQGDTPVVLLNGARQTGKSTLVRLVGESTGARYITLDDATALSAASADPQGFLAGLPDRVIIDEAQRAPGLFPAIKKAVDEDRSPGRFLLTGSANVLFLPRLSETLAGRMEILTLTPLSQGELRSRRERFIDAAFSGSPPAFAGGADGDGLPDLLAGGYPEAIGRATGKRRAAWFSSYVTTLLQRDVRDLANIEGLVEMPRLLTLLAGRTTGLLNMSELSRSSGIPNSTLKRYLGLLRATFLLQPLPAWSGNPGKRLIKSPKVHLIDTGIAAHLTGQTEESLQPGNPFLGPLVESFVVGELRKQAGWSERKITLHHYRTTAGRKVDLLLEDAAGRLVGIEVKSARSVDRKDFAGLRALAEDVGPRFHRGFVLYTGDQAVSFGDRLQALPVASLWQVGSPETG